MNYLSLDVGTTCCKCQLFSEDGEILEYRSEEYGLLCKDGETYVDVVGVWSRIKKAVKEIGEKYEISSLCVSSFGEAFVLLDEADEILFFPMLYTDPRGEKEAKRIAEQIGEERVFEIAGVTPHSMYSVSKLLWIKNNYPDRFARAKKAMLICDYIGYLFTGKRVIDYSLASRTGAFDIGKLEFSQEIFRAVGIPVELFSEPRLAGSVVGKLTAECKAELGLTGDPVLILGSHDQVCTALGAGVLESGDAVDGMGTVECITMAFDKKSDAPEMGKQGYCCTPYAVEGLYCTYIFNYSCGSTVNWLRKNIMHGYKGEEKDFFTYIEKDMPKGPTGILTLPYFGGSGTPYQDLNAKGAIINLTTATSDAALYKSFMEGTAMEMRLNTDVAGRYVSNVTSAVATGGGANSEKWLQVKADIQNVPFKTLRSSEGGLCGCAMLQAVALGGAKDLKEARDIFVRYDKEFLPNAAMHRSYENQYDKYKKLYQTIKEFN